MPGASGIAMTERELVDALCDLRPEWDARRAELHAEQIYYAHIGTLGQELARAALEPLREPWIERAFTVIEHALEVGTTGTENLVVVGLFEAMQNVAYAHPAPGHVIEDQLGLLSRVAWEDLIEGWTGAGIRTISAWRERGGRR
jgi:hypothetical protein